jgi:hypothetical protein
MGTGEVVTADRTFSDAYVEEDLRIGSMFKNLCAFAALGAGGLIAVTPAFAAEYPVRWTTGGAVWSTEQEAFDTFVDTGEVTDRGEPGALSELPAHPRADGAALDRAVLALDAAGRARVQALFAEAARLERAFFDSAYDESLPAG